MEGVESVRDEGCGECEDVDGVEGVESEGEGGRV